MLDWHWPWIALAAPLPWVLRWLLPALEIRPQALRVPFHRALTSLSASAFPTERRAEAPLAALMWLALVAAAARPVWFGEPEPVVASGRDLLLAIDLSDSMKIDDMLLGEERSTRIDTIRRVARDFVERREGDRVGLILFGQRSYLQTPLTFDRAAVAVELDEALPGFAGSSTAIGDAIGTAISTLRDREAAGRVLILMTDGANTAGSEPDEALAVAVEAGIRIHTIGVGSRAPRQVTDPAGERREIDPARDLDEATLARIARATGGRYFRAADPGSMRAVYAAIDALEPAAEERFARPSRSLFHWPLAFALVAAAALVALRGR